MKNVFSSTSKKNVTILGYKTAGKSTVIEQLIENKILRERREETHGSKTREIKIQLGDKEHEFRITDIGGSELYQNMFWKADVAKSDGVIYVVDSSLLNECKGLQKDLGNWVESEEYCPNYQADDKIIKCNCPENEMFRGSRRAKAFAFSILDLGKPILVLLNKADLQENQRIYTEDEIIKLYKLKTMVAHNIKITPASALTGENIFESINWLFEQME